MRDITEDDADK
jgi:site-specific recombinase XerD